MPIEQSTYRIRPMTVLDIPECQTLFRSTVLIVNSIGALDEQDGIIGFSSMNTEGYLHSMFVHKDWQHKGVASLLLSEVEKMAHGYGVYKISVEVSITARPFFEKRGYKMVKVQKARANRLYLTNYVMEKSV